MQRNKWRDLAFLVLTILPLTFLKVDSIEKHESNTHERLSILEPRDRISLDKLSPNFSSPIFLGNAKMSISLNNNNYKISSPNFSHVIIKQYSYDKKLIKEYISTEKSGTIPYGQIKVTAIDKFNNSTSKEIENFKPQSYIFRNGELTLLANLIHRELCVSTLEYKHSKSESQRAAMATGYCLINRAINNHGNIGKTITAQLDSIQYGTGGSAALSGKVVCDKCYKIALKCSKYDSTYNYCIRKKSVIPMSNDVTCQSGWCVKVEKDLEGECWWHFDTDQDGVEDNAGHSQDGCWDEFFEKCQCCTEHWHTK